MLSMVVLGIVCILILLCIAISKRKGAWSVLAVFDGGVGEYEKQ